MSSKKKKREIPELGAKVKVYWTGENTWYRGEIIGHIDPKVDPQGREGLAQIRYEEDNSVYVHDFTFENWKPWIRRFECVSDMGVAYRYMCGDIESRVRVPRGPDKGTIVIAKEVKGKNWIRVVNPKNPTGGDFWLPIKIKQNEIFRSVPSDDEEEEEEEEEEEMDEEEEEKQEDISIEEEDDLSDSNDDSKMEIDSNEETDVKDENDNYIEEYPCSLELKHYPLRHKKSNEVRHV